MNGPITIKQSSELISTDHNIEKLNVSLIKELTWWGCIFSQRFVSGSIKLQTTI